MLILRQTVAQRVFIEPVDKAEECPEKTGYALETDAGKFESCHWASHMTLLTLVPFTLK